MAVNQAAVGTGISISYGGTVINDVYEIGLPDITIEKIDATHYLSTEYREYITGDLKTPNEMTVTCAFHPGDDIEIGGAAESLVISFPAASTGAHSAASWSVQAIVIGRNYEAPIEELMKQTITFQFSGEITVA